MATRSRIGIELADGSILSAYHHWDGYPTWLGNTLKEHYNTRADVAELIDGGDMSVCWTQQKFAEVDGRYQIVDREDGQYGPQHYSQRGEDCPPRYDASLIDYLNNDPEEYAYVYNRFGEWIAYEIDWNTDTARLVDIRPATV